MREQIELRGYLNETIGESAGGELNRGAIHAL